MQMVVFPVSFADTKWHLGQTFPLPSSATVAEAIPAPFLLGSPRVPVILGQNVLVILGMVPNDIKTLFSFNN